MNSLQIQKMFFKRRSTSFSVHSQHGLDRTTNVVFSRRRGKHEDLGLIFTGIWQEFEEIEQRLKKIHCHCEVSRLPALQEPGENGLKAD